MWRRRSLIAIDLIWGWLSFLGFRPLNWPLKIFLTERLCCDFQANAHQAAKQYLKYQALP